MTIVHYFLGFPPYRSGGMTKYSVDLMKAQVADNNLVIALWPGKMKSFFKNVAIKARKSYCGILNYEMINPLPIPLDEGILEIEEYIKCCNEKVFEDFFTEINPDAIHIHTLMGLYKEFIDVAEKKGIRTVYTTHDYFGICPKVTLYRCGQVCDDDNDCGDCFACNKRALSINKIRILQSPLYRKMKNNIIVKMLRAKHRKEHFVNDEIMDVNKEEKSLSSTHDYKKLRLYYINIMEKIDCIHFNSSLTKRVFDKYITPKSSIVMSITHKNIIDNREKNKSNESDVLKIGYLAPAKPYKGFDILVKVLDDIWKEKKIQFILKLYGNIPIERPYMEVNRKGYTHEELGTIMNDTDILVAPSIWYETFGFTILEAISFGVPVVVSDHVGAKDVIGNGGIIVEAGNETKLKEAIQSLSPDMLHTLRTEINKLVIKSWKDFVYENYELYH